MNLRKEWWLERPRIGFPQMDMPLDQAKATQSDKVEYPDDWFIVYGTSGSVKTAGPGGFITLSKKGYEANKKAILEAWVASTPHANYKSQLLCKTKAEKAKFAEDIHMQALARMEENTRKRVSNIKNELAILEAALESKFM